MKVLRERIDLMVYVRALGVLVRNPSVVVVPLLVAVLGVLVHLVAGDTSGGFGAGITAGITSFILSLLQLFGLGVAIIIGDLGWRRQRASFDEGFSEARRKGGDLLFAAFGFVFVVSIAAYAGTILGGILIDVLLALALYGLIYSIAAPAIGGVPGGGAISVSIERVRAAPVTAAILAAVAIVPFYYFYFPNVTGASYGDLFVDTSTTASLIRACIEAVLTGYLGIVMAKVYNDVSYPPLRY